MPTLLAWVLDVNPAQWLGPCSLLPACPSAWYFLSLRFLWAADPGPLLPAPGLVWCWLYVSCWPYVTCLPVPAAGFDLPAAGPCIRTLCTWAKSVCSSFKGSYFPRVSLDPYDETPARPPRVSLHVHTWVWTLSGSSGWKSLYKEIYDVYKSSVLKIIKN